MQSQVTILLTLIALLTMVSKCSRPSQYMMESNFVPQAVLTVESQSMASSNQFKAEVRINHQGEGVLEINTWLHTVPGLVLEVVDSSGETIPHLPPPVPDEAAIKAAVKILKSGESHVFTLQGLAIDAGFMPPGKYQVRFKGNFELIKESQRSELVISSEWQGFAIR